MRQASTGCKCGQYQAARFRGYPKAIRTDQGREFTGRALDQWAYEHGIQLKLIQPGTPAASPSRRRNGCWQTGQDAIWLSLVSANGVASVRAGAVLLLR